MLHIVHHLHSTVYSDINFFTKNSFDPYFILASVYWHSFIHVCTDSVREQPTLSNNYQAIGIARPILSL